MISSCLQGGGIFITRGNWPTCCDCHTCPVVLKLCSLSKTGLCLLSCGWTAGADVQRAGINTGRMICREKGGKRSGRCHSRSVRHLRLQWRKYHSCAQRRHGCGCSTCCRWGRPLQDRTPQGVMCESAKEFVASCVYMFKERRLWQSTPISSKTKAESRSKLITKHAQSDHTTASPTTSAGNRTEHHQTWRLRLHGPQKK